MFEKKLTTSDNFEGIALCYGVKGNYNEAMNYFRQGISKNPNSARLYFNAAITFNNMGEKDSSDIYFNKAFILDPSMKK